MNSWNDSLQDSVDFFFQDENLSDFKCESCESFGYTTIQNHLAKIPRILVLNLKRHQLKSSLTGQENSFRFIKNDSEIKIPIFLTLNRSNNATNTQPSNINDNTTNESLKKEPESNNYRLIGIVNHLGESSTSGHYISDIYDIKKNEWSSFDDENVSIISEKKIITDRTKSGYIFFYINKYSNFQN